jgi:hypothetical protein
MTENFAAKTHRTALGWTDKTTPFQVTEFMSMTAAVPFALRSDDKVESASWAATSSSAAAAGWRGR